MLFFFSDAQQGHQQKDVKQIFGKKNPPKFTTRRKYMNILWLTDQSLQSAPKTFGYGTVGWFQVLKKMPRCIFSEENYEDYFFSSQLHQIQWFRRLFLRKSMSQVDQAQQNHTSADSQK